MSARAPENVGNKYKQAEKTPAIVADWYDQMFYFVRAEMECYTNMLLLMQDIEQDKEWRKEDFVEPDDNV